MHRKTDEMLRVCLANFGYIGICEQVSDLVDYSAQVFQRRYSILVSAGAVATNWSERGIALTSACLSLSPVKMRIRSTTSLVIVFVTFLHSLTPHIGVYIMNVRI